jgi:hypothetical protein
VALVIYKGAAMKILYKETLRVPDNENKKKINILPNKGKATLSFLPISTPAARCQKHHLSQSRNLY